MKLFQIATLKINLKIFLCLLIEVLKLEKQIGLNFSEFPLNL